MNERSLQDVDGYSKLILVGHGSATTIAKYTPEALAVFLYAHGLREAGLISFKSCKIGSSQFLYAFRDAICSKGIKVGWLIGYKSSVSMHRARDTSLFTGHLISHPRLASGLSALRAEPNDAELHDSGMKQSDADRILILQGNSERYRRGTRRFASPQALLYESEEFRAMRPLTLAPSRASAIDDAFRPAFMRRK